MARQLPTQLKHDTYSDRAYVRWAGEKKYFGKWGSQQSFEAFAAWLKERIPNPPRVAVPQDKITVVDCIARYLVHAEAYYSVNGEPSQEFVNVKAALDAVLKSVTVDTRAIDYGPKRLKDLQRSLAAAVVTPRKKKSATTEIAPQPPKLKYARTTINAMVNRIRRAFRWCASEELIPIELVTALESVPGLPKGRQMARESEPVTSVSFHVVADTLPYLSPTVAAMVQLQALGGMRPQDICGMTTGAIDTSGDIWLYRPAHHKGSHRDQLLVKALPKPAQDILRPLLRANLAEPIFSPVDSKAWWISTWRKKDTPAKTPKRRIRTFYSSGSYGASIKLAIKQANKNGESVPHWAPNQLRHAIATELRRTAGLEAAQAYLGHAKPDTTLIYAEQTVAALLEVARGFVSPLVERRQSKRG